MKNWENAELTVLELRKTNYGGTTTKEFDYLYQNAEGNWEGTFVAS